jgi:hypothetical protein
LIFEKKTSAISPFIEAFCALTQIVTLKNVIFEKKTSAVLPFLEAFVCPNSNCYAPQ